MSGIVGSKLNHRGSGLTGSLGTDGQHLLSAGAGKTNVFETVAAAGVTAAEGTAIRQDITTLALKQAVNENKAAFNLPNTFIDQFEDSTGIGSTSTAGRHADEYIGSLSTTTTTGVTINSANHATYFASGKGTIWWAGTTNTGYDYVSTSNTGASAYSGTNPADAFTSTGLGLSVSGGARYNMLRFDFNLNKLKPTSVRYYLAGGHTYTSGVKSEAFNTIPSSIGTAPTDLELFQTDSSVTNGTTYGNASISTSTYYQHFNIRQDDSDGCRWGNLVFIGDVQATALVATGNIISIVNVPTAAQTKVSGVALYKDEEGTATIGTDLKIYFTCNGGTNWTEVPTYTAVTPVFSSGIKMLKLAETTCTSGSDVRYKAAWANQSSGSKETYIYGIGMNY